jgi:glutamate dehydrogenase (NAD(P)+)
MNARARSRRVEDARGTEMTDPFALGDDLGPAKVIHVQEPAIGLRGVLVVDNVAAGPSIGGLRMAEDVSAEECFRLARAMTLKNAAAGLRHGGGKSVLFGDPKMPRADKERLVRGFAAALGDISDYIFGPDMGTDEVAMSWVHDETTRSAARSVSFVRSAVSRWTRSAPPAGACSTPPRLRACGLA